MWFFTAVPPHGLSCELSRVGGMPVGLYELPSPEGARNIYPPASEDAGIAIESHVYEYMR